MTRWSSDCSVTPSINHRGFPTGRAAPLTERQIGYALDDVVHLRDVYDELRKRVQESGREQWLAEELGVLTNPNTYINLPEEAWRRIKIRSAKPRHLAILQEIAAWREREAQSRNIPRNRVIRDEAISEISAHPPKAPEDLKHLRNFPKGLAHQADGTSIINIVTAALRYRYRKRNFPSLKPGPDPTRAKAQSSISSRYC